MYGQRPILKPILALFITLLLILGLTSLPHSSAYNGGIAVGPSPFPNEPAIPTSLDLPTSGLFLTLDPALAQTNESLTAVEGLFFGLTDIHPETGEIVPELATEWIVSEDGLTWTFYLRDDVNWMKYDPALEEAMPVRPVVASDVVNGIKRACDPTVSAPNAGLLAEIIAGCDIFYQTIPVGGANDPLQSDVVEVYAPDDTTVVINLQHPISYFLPITTLAAMRPVPLEVIDDYGLEWTQPNHIVTNGAYFLDEIEPTQYRVFVRNHAVPADMQHSGNIERVVYHVIPDWGSQFSLYNDHIIDLSTITAVNVEAVLNNPQYTNQVVRLFDISVYYFGFDHHQLPFNDVHVRRAFSAILDRQAFLDQLNNERGIPMDRFTPPGFEPETDEDLVGQHFDALYARDEMARAGYPNCENFPTIKIKTFRNSTEWGNFLADAAETYLGCDESLFEIIPIVNTVIGPDLRDANVWTGIWQPTYPDIHAWLGEGVGCEGQNLLRRTCSEIDELIFAAAIETDPTLRQAMYADVEAAMFGTDGEVPLTPIFVEAGAFLLVKPWLQGPFLSDGTFGAIHWDAYRVNMSDKLAVRSQ